jgi:hypothetical protein
LAFDFGDSVSQVLDFLAKLGKDRAEGFGKTGVGVADHSLSMGKNVTASHRDDEAQLSKKTCWRRSEAAGILRVCRPRPG